MKIWAFSLLVTFLALAHSGWAKKSDIQMIGFEPLLESEYKVVEEKTDSVLYQFHPTDGVGFVFGTHVANLFCKALGHKEFKTSNSFTLDNNPSTVLKLDVAFEARKYFEGDKSNQLITLQPKDLLSYGRGSEDETDYSNVIGPEFEFSISFTKEHGFSAFEKLTSKLANKVNSDVKLKKDPKMSLIVRLIYDEVDPNDVEQSNLATEKLSCKKLETLAQ